MGWDAWNSMSTAIMEIGLVSLLIAFLIFRCLSSTLAKGSDIRNLLRNKRYLVYPNPKGSETKVQVLFGLGLPMESEVSMTLGYVFKCNYNLPYNASDDAQTYIEYTKRSSRKAATRKRRMLSSEVSISRWELYRMMKTALEALGSGKACLLRAVCETAKEPFRKDDGLLGELLHVVLTPSTTFEEYEIPQDREYHSAEIIGRTLGADCEYHYYECPYNPLDYFTELGTIAAMDD